MRKINLIGQKFGKLTIVEEVRKENNPRIFWKCLCDCGGECITDGTKLRQGLKTHCGCERPKPSNFEDLTGQRFGMLTVIKQVPKPEGLKRNGVYWLCKCDCGNDHIVLTCNLKSGHVTNCGCIKRRKTSERCTKDITGKRFGRLTVVKRVENYISPNGNTNTKWLCQCDCGNYIEVIQSGLTRGMTQSCGCLFKEKASERFFEDLTGQKFGKLTVLERTENLIHPSGGYSVRWECQCECGNQVIVTSGNLKNGHTVSCGCISSKNEMKIGQILQRYEYEYKPQYIFKDCKDDGYLRFDFGVLINNKLLCVIEYDGEQHYIPVKYGNITDEQARKNFLNTQRRDKIKNNYCKSNNIKILRIPYWEKDNLEEIIITYLDNLVNLNEEQVS